MTNHKTRRLVLCAMMAALSLLFLFIGTFLPTGRMALCALAGLFIGAVVTQYRLPAGGLTYATVSVLSLLVLPSKGIALMFVLVFGLYALVKSLIEMMHRLVLEWICKLLFCGVWTAVFLYGLPGLLTESFVIPGWAPSLLFAATGTAFVLYDIALTQILTFLDNRLRKIK